MTGGIARAGDANQLVEEVFLLLAMIANETPRAIVPAQPTMA
ncbi:hypothetical protein [Mesorhizobium sp. ISC15]